MNATMTADNGEQVGVKVPSAVALLAARATQNRKFTDDEVTAELAEMAKAYLRTYTGTFEFLVSIRESMARNDGRLYVGQVRGVLNCMLADLRRNPPAPAPVATDGKAQFWARPSAGITIKNGIYTVVLEDGSHRTIRVQQAKLGPDAKEKQFVAFLNGPRNTSDYQRCGLIKGGQYTWIYGYGRLADAPLRKAIEFVLGMTPKQERDAGKLYAMESGNCFRCGAVLTEPESIEAGLGPICRGKE